MDAPPRLQHHSTAEAEAEAIKQRLAFPCRLPDQYRYPRAWGQHRTVGPGLLDAHRVRLTAHRRQGRAERAGSGPVRTLSVVFRHFIPYGPRAHGHMTDRACCEDRH